MNQALLLCAGIGARLRPLTDVLPKCLVPVRGIPLLEYWLHRLCEGAAQFDRIVVNTHHQADLVREYVEQSPWRDRVTLTEEQELLGTGGTIKANVARFDEREPLLLAHADNLTVFELREFLLAHRDRPSVAQMTMMSFTTPTPESCGVLEMNSQGVVERFHEKVKNPPSDIANAAVYLLEPGVVRAIALKPGPFVDFSNEVIPAYLGRIGTFHNRVYHRDIGTVASWKAAQVDFPASAEPPRRMESFLKYWSKATADRLEPALHAVNLF